MWPDQILFIIYILEKNLCCLKGFMPGVLTKINTESTVFREMNICLKVSKKKECLSTKRVHEV